MIKANELRIGNKVFLKSLNKIYTIECGFDIEKIEDGDDALPIPLTEDWLLKLGFEKTMTWTYTIDLLGSLKLVYYLGEKGWSLGFKNYSDFSNLKYLHELQNLYFALTGKELEMKGGNNE
jgi:hypothetical protein